MFKEFFNKDTNKRQRANMWTFSRLVLSFGIPIVAIFGKLITATILTSLAAFTDFMDGKSARKHKSVSSFGIKLDILADKVFSFMMGISLSLVNPLFLFNILGEAIISFINIYYKSKYNLLHPCSSFIGKIKQWPLFATFTLGYLTIFLPWLTNINNILIFISFILQLNVAKDYLIKNNNMVRNKSINVCRNKINKDTDKIINDKCLKDEYTNLRSVISEVSFLESNTEVKNNEKIKKRKLY